ncbi:hypothetical protein JCM8202v2_001357 [Rhodotorula sphaerocarpa]
MRAKSLNNPAPWLGARLAAYKGKGKERDLDEDFDELAISKPKRRLSRESSATAETGAGRATRRRSGNMTAPSSSQGEEGDAQPLRRSRRRSSQSQLEVDARMDEERSRAGPSTGPPQKRRHTRSTSITELEPIDDDEDEEAADSADQVIDDLEAKLYTWSPDQLHTLRLAELLDLVNRLYADSPDDPHPRTKDKSIQAILAARPPESTSEESAEDDDGQLTPYPQTSQENSSEQAESSSDSEVQQSRERAGAARADTGVTPRRRGPKRRSRVRPQEPTPPPSASDGDSESDRGDGDATEVDAGAQDTPRADHGTGTSMARRSSQVEMPPPPLPRRPLRADGATGSGPAGAGLTLFGRNFGLAGHGHVPGATPVAFRTRGHARPPKSPSPPPSHVAADRQLRTRDRGSSPEPTAPSSRDSTMSAGVVEDNSPGSSSDGYGSGAESAEASKGALLRRDSTRRANGREGEAEGQRGRRRSARAVKQIITPPSDADEESGGEAAEGAGSKANGTTEAKSQQRQAGRGSRLGKVVRLSRSKSYRPSGEDVEMQNGDDSDGSDEYEPDDQDDQQEDEVDLAEVTEPMLMRYRKDDLVRLCEERDIDHGGRKKAQLVDALLQWRDMDVDASSPVSAASSSASTLSNVSVETARQETKSENLRKAEHASDETRTKKPLLMRSHHSASPEKPQTPEHEKTHEQQEDVNALDLESLQLQDKEIQPDKLTKLERVGSGGFKDVYKGLYRKRTIAICEIRGHLTEMDIKELGLLRDLRHPNIVQFIGISLPKQPSHIPVMIITELCANGDLFDYIRKIDPPPFVAMLDIMLGIARGIEYLHLHKPAIIHRDIKSSNVLISAQGVAKIADFGLARIKNSTKSVIRSLVGTVNWQAPELWHPHPRYNEKVDVYSAGLVFWEVLQWHQPVKRYPFEGQNEHAIYHDVGVKKIRPHPGPLRRQWGGEIVDLMQAMWEQEPAQRPAMSEVVANLELLRKDHVSKKPSSKERR